MNLTNGGTNLPEDGTWIPTTELCFTVTEEVLSNPSECLGLVWARTGRTDGIATAFVEVSEWVEANVTTEAFANEFDDLDAEDGDAFVMIQTAAMYPNVAHHKMFLLYH